MAKEIKVDERGREQIPAWYGIAITTNKEKVVRGKIQALTQMEQWKDQIFDCILPSYTEVNDKGKEVEKLFYTQVGYVHMILNSDTWNALELLRGVGFRAILPAGDAQPIPEHEMRQIFKMIGRNDEEELLFKDGVSPFEENDVVKIIGNDAFSGQIGRIHEVILEKKEALVLVEMLGNETKVRVPFSKLTKFEK